MSELENGRLFRLLCKFGFINERPEFALDPKWSETGDRYIIKLFRDYVFHQVNQHGKPVVNLSHVLTCLNKVSLLRLGSHAVTTDRCGSPLYFLWAYHCCFIISARCWCG